MLVPFVQFDSWSLISLKMNSGTAAQETLSGGPGNDSLTPQPFFLSPITTHLSIHGGGGDDFIQYSQSRWNDQQVSATGGEGADTFSISLSPLRRAPLESASIFLLTRQPEDEQSTRFEITDFAAGPGGDRLDVLGLIRQGGVFAGKPFEAGNPMDPEHGCLRLVQDGDDTLLQYDPDGAEGDRYLWSAVVRLLDVEAGSLTADNFVGAIAPDGSPMPGMVMTGSAGEDRFSGATADDTIRGGASADVLNGGAGHDVLRGGGGRDRLQGEEGDDRVVGGRGHDTLSRDWGGGSDTLLGGMGNDTILVHASEADGTDRTVRVAGGDGDDRILSAFGDPHDQLSWWLDDASVPAGRTTLIASGGAGSDTFELLQAGTASLYTITDFMPGAGGDRLDLRSLLVSPYSHFQGGNPMSARNGYFRLEQRGDDTVLAFDDNGTAGPKNGWHDIAVLRNVEAGALTADNFAGGLAPDGSPGEGQTLRGRPGRDHLAGDVFDDTLLGSEGNETLDGGAGNDDLRGGAGDDGLFYSRGDDRLSGGDGRDTFYLDPVAQKGGGHVVVDGGRGDDDFRFYLRDAFDARITATGGAGIDTFVLAAAGFDTGITITDFAAGAGGDRLTMTGWGSQQQQLPSGMYFAGDDPTQARHDHLRLLQEGADTLVQWDDDGPAEAGFDWLTVARLKDVRATDLEDHNFDPVTREADEFGDRLSGSLGRDQLIGGEGPDSLDGGRGADTLAGGAGNDLYRVDDADDQVMEAAGRDTGGVDTVMAHTSWSLSDTAPVERLRIAGSGDIDMTGNWLDNLLYAGAGDNLLDGRAGTDTVGYRFAKAAVTVSLALEGPQSTGGSGRDTLQGIENLSGSAHADRLGGDAGANRLSGREGDDQLTGGAGPDTFVLAAGFGSDTITDFRSGEDHLRVLQHDAPIGDGDDQVDGAARQAGAGGFSNTAEYVLITDSTDGELAATSAAARIGSATSDYAEGRTALFMVNNGADSALYLFTALDTDARVEAHELKLLATLTGSSSIGLGDLMFGG
jgi:Ca2+-binding RTX toxin-like protein